MRGLDLGAISIHPDISSRFGFFTTLSVARADAALSPAIDTAVDGAAAEIEGLERGAGFVVFIREGLVDTLEGFSFEEPWPDQIGEFRLYLSDSRRVIDIPD